MAKTSILIGFVASLLLVSLIAYSLPVFAQGPDSIPGKPDIIGVSGITHAKDMLVHILLVVPPGENRNDAAVNALAQHGARSFTAEEYSTIDLFWDRFSDGDPGNDSVIQNYNPKKDSTRGNGLTALLNTHNSWNDVDTSNFTFEYGGETGRCPSLVDECKGRQNFDGNNDVAWVALRSANTLGVTWSGTSIDEADMALNTKFNWTTDFDAETVFLHENGHAAGLGHSADIDAIMYPSYQAQNRILQQDDIDGISFLYPGTSPLTNIAPTITITNPADGVKPTSGSTINFAGTASDNEDGALTDSITWTSSIDGSIGTGGSFSTFLNDGTHSITAQVTDSGGKTSSTSIAITVGTPSVTGTTVGVDSITHTTSGGKQNDRHLVVSAHASDNSGPDVSGASVSIKLVNGGNSWTATGTTGSTGNISFTLKNSPSGTYTVTITGISTSGLEWNGDSYETIFTK